MLGFPVLAVRAPDRWGQIALSVVFTTNYAGKPSVRRGRWSADCTETRFAANGPAKTAPKPVFLPRGRPDCTETRLAATGDGTLGALPTPGHATWSCPARSPSPHATSPRCRPQPPPRRPPPRPPARAFAFPWRVAAPRARRLASPPPPVPTFSISRKFAPCAHARPYSSGLRRGDKGICASETP